MTITSSNIFEGINSIAQLSMATIVGIGVYVAYHQLKVTRNDAPRRRKAELAEEMIVVVSQVEDAFRHIRNPFDSIPTEKLHDKEFVYRKRYERISESNELFQKMRDLQIRCDAVMPGTELQGLVTELNNARSEIAFAIEDLLELVDRVHANEYAEEMNRARRVLYGGWSEKDSFGQKIVQNVKEIKSRVGLAANFSEKKK